MTHGYITKNIDVASPFFKLERSFKTDAYNPDHVLRPIGYSPPTDPNTIEVDHYDYISTTENHNDIKSQEHDDR
jgi:hypothetical protein